MTDSPSRRRAVTWVVLVAALGLLLGLVAVAWWLLRPDEARRPASGSIPAEDLRVHDCVAELPSGTVRTVRLVPCSAEHLGEVYDTADLPDGPFPGDAGMARLAQARCSRTLPAYVGVPAGTPDGYSISYLAPLASTWSTGDREVTCLLSDPTGAELTGSAEGRGPAATSAPTAR